MAAFNVSLDDSSPLISYSPPNAWLDTPANDTLSKFYSQGSLHTASVDGATAQLSFNGTGVWLYGGIRPYYGSFTLLVDGVTIVQASASATDPELGHLLGGITGLKMGEHTVSLKADGSGPIDLDSVIFETSVGSAGESVATTTIDDTDTNFKYGPSASDWARDNSTLFFDNSLHFSQIQGAEASLSFSGDAVAVYGTVSPSHANYTITLDGHTSQQFNAASSVRELHSQTLLYFAQNLGAADHNLVITGNPGQNTGKYVDVDFIAVYSASGNQHNQPAGSPIKNSASSTPVITSSSTSTMGASGTATDMTDIPTITASSTASSSTSTTDPYNNSKSLGANIDATRLSGGAVAGIVIGSLLGLLALLLLLFFLLRRRRGQSIFTRSKSDNPDTLTPALPIQDPDLEAAYEYEAPTTTEKQMHMVKAEYEVYAQLDAMGRRMTSATGDTRWSQGSYDSSSTLRQTEPPFPKWDTSGPVPNLVLANDTNDGAHSRNPSDTSTVVAEEIRQGVSEVALRPTYLSAGPKSAPVRPPRPSSLTSVTRYYFET